MSGQSSATKRGERQSMKTCNCSAMTPEQRLRAARELKDRAYPQGAKDVRATRGAWSFPWQQCLYLWPEPQGQESLRAVIRSSMCPAQ